MPFEYIYFEIRNIIKNCIGLKYKLVLGLKCVTPVLTGTNRNMVCSLPHFLARLFTTTVCFDANLSSRKWAEISQTHFTQVRDPFFEAIITHNTAWLPTNSYCAIFANSECLGMVCKITVSSETVLNVCLRI